MSTKHLVYKRNKGFQRLSGGMAHDLNNIIMILNGFTGCLKKSPGLDEKQMRYIDQIDKATAQVGNLTNTLLTLCEGSILNMSYFNLGELLESFITEKKKGKDFCHKMDLISDIGEAFIYFDRKGMLTVLENLYENSIYPDEESRQISYKISRMVFSETDHREGMSPGSYIVLDISDDGPGIKNEASSEIFDPYYSTKPRGKGKGLGLSVSAEIIQQCGAFIEIILGSKKGFLVRILFQDNSKKSINKSEDISSGRPGKTILLIDEDENIRELMKQALVLSGYSVYSTSSVAEGLNIINAFPVDILVAEVLLADSDEYQQILNIQKSERNLNIILLTSYSNEKVELREIENFRFLQKPIKPSILIKEIQNIERGEALL